MSFSQMTLKSFDEEVDLNVSSKSSFEELKEAVERLIQYEVTFLLPHSYIYSINVFCDKCSVM